MTALLERPPARERARRALRRHRILLGCVLAVACGMGIGGALVLGEVLNLSDALGTNKAIKTPGLAKAGFGDAQTFLLVGDDQRTLTGAFKHYSKAVLPHSNEMLLVRVDPNLPYISMMSIPRELEVTIHPKNQKPVTTRFNYAYTAGGIPLLVSTIHQVLGVSVNHVMVVTFGRFSRAIDQMGCVYTTIDKRYFHVNVPGGEQYQEINLQPGYQKLCGTQAVQFVSYRHGDDSLVRDSRDQSLLLDVKQQYGPTLSGNLNKFERIFGAAVQTDSGLHDPSTILSLGNTLVSSSARAVRQVKFQANLSPTGPNPCSCVTATARQIQASVNSWLHGPPPATKSSHAAATAHSVGSRHGLAQQPLTPISALTIAAARDVATRVPMTFEFPRVQDREGSSTQVGVRDYLIRAPNGRPYPAYVGVFATGSLGQYYNVQGTTWPNPPLLTGTSQTVQAGGRTYTLIFQSGQLQTVGWHEGGATYWVRNSLSQALPAGEMLAIAEQTKVLPAVLSAAGRRTAVSLRAAAVHVKAATTKDEGLRETLGGIAGIVGLLAIGALGVLTLRRRRTVAELRVAVDAHVARESRLRAVVARRRARARARRAQQAAQTPQPPDSAQPQAPVTRP